MVPLSWNDIHFAQPWAFAMVLLVLLGPALAWLGRSYRERHKGADTEFVSSKMREHLFDNDETRPSFTRTTTVLFWLSALMLSLALTRPQWGVLEETVHQRGLDIVIAIDLSSSMRAEDISPSRIENARQELAFLVDSLKGNRIGLVGFAGSAFLFCPLTLDTDAVELFLEEMTIEAVPVPGTALGDAIKTGLQTFEMSGESQGGSRVILLLTDGEDHESQPLEAAKQAAKEGVIIDTIGLGTAAGSNIPDPTTGGMLKDDNGQEVISRLDGGVLEEISKLTGGQFLRLESSKNGLSPYLETLKKRETRAFGESTDVRRHERFPYFVLAAAISFLLALSLEEWDKRR